MGAELEGEDEKPFGLNDITDFELTCHIRDVLTSVHLVEPCRVKPSQVEPSRVEPSRVKPSRVELSRGDDESYHQLVGIMYRTKNSTPDELALLVTCLKSLSGAVSCMDSIHHETLLQSIFEINMWNHAPSVMDSLVEFVVSLAASSGEFVDWCLEMLVTNIVPPKIFLFGSSESHEKKVISRRLLSDKRVLRKKEQVLSRVLLSLNDISDLVPLAPLRLLPIIIEKMPNIYVNEPIAIYVEGMLRLESSSIGVLVGSTIVMSIVDKLIDMDVEIGWDDVVPDDEGNSIFELELEEFDVAADTNQFDKFANNLSHKFQIGEKLDDLMGVTFEHLKLCCKERRLLKVFEPLLQSFRITILHTYKSKFAQFVIFYACSLDPENCTVKFVTLLAEIFVCSAEPPSTRMSAVAYLASFLSRAKFITAPLIITMLKRIIKWCSEYCKNQGGVVNPASHRVFYSGCQAVLYVLCFRMKSLMRIPRLKSELLLMGLDAILKHGLSPLRVCLSAIVEEFLEQAKACMLFTGSECVTLNAIFKSRFSSAFRLVERLDMFFPFDPCILPQCDRFIRPNYIYWSMVLENNKNDDDNDESELSSGDEDDDEKSCVLVDETEGSEGGYMLDKMSI